MKKFKDFITEKKAQYQAAFYKGLYSRNKGIFYRLRIGPFDNIDSTYDICKSFDIEINSCIILEEK